MNKYKVEIKFLIENGKEGDVFFECTFMAPDTIEAEKIKLDLEAIVSKRKVFPFGNAHSGAILTTL